MGARQARPGHSGFLIQGCDSEVEEQSGRGPESGTGGLPGVQQHLESFLKAQVLGTWHEPENHSL